MDYKYQFGNSQAAINLAKILKEPKYAQYLGKTQTVLAKFNHFINQIDLNIQERETRIALINLVRDAYKTKIANAKMPEVIKSHCLNVFAKNCRLANLSDSERNDFRRKSKEPRYRVRETPDGVIVVDTQTVCRVEIDEN